MLRHDKKLAKAFKKAKKTKDENSYIIVNDRNFENLIMQRIKEIHGQ